MSIAVTQKPSLFTSFGSFQASGLITVPPGFLTRAVAIGRQRLLLLLL
jgi:hypothetical protein